jgi:hypothetical protein
MKNDNIWLYCFQFYICIFIYFFQKIISKIYIYNIWKNKYSNTYEKKYWIINFFFEFEHIKYEYKFHKKKVCQKIFISNFDNNIKFQIFFRNSFSINIFSFSLIQIVSLCVYKIRKIYIEKK